MSAFLSCPQADGLAAILLSMPGIIELMPVQGLAALEADHAADARAGLFADLKPQEGIASWFKPRLLGKFGVPGIRFFPTSLQSSCCRALLVSPGQVIPQVYFWSLCPSAVCDRGQSAQLSSFHPALHNLSALWALQVLCMCFLAGPLANFPGSGPWCVPWYWHRTRI